MPDNYLESFKAALLLKDSYRRLPKDEEFKDQLLIKDVYNFRNRNYLLRKLENYDRKEFVNIESYTIEHIMPQNENLSYEWKQELGENWKEVHDKYLHTIGNLTLTGYNSELSDRPFKEKRDMKGGFKDSPIRLNNYLAKLDNWNEQEIIKRAKALSDLTVKIWSYPTLDEETLKKYSKEEPENIYTIDDYAYVGEGEPMRQLFEELRKRILNLDSSVREEVLKLYIAYKTVTNFVDIVPQKSKLKLSLNMQFDEINDPKGICKDVTDKGKWYGNGDVEVNVSKFEELDYVMFLIKQAFDKISEEKL
jgi:predicted transport protein